MCKDCPICMEPLFPSSNKNMMRLKKKVLVKRGERLPITKLKCGHSFHNSCIKGWFMKTDIESSDKCPMCRDKIRFEKNSKDLMMNKLRWRDPYYMYGDENLYDIETDSDYSESESDSGSESGSESESGSDSGSELGDSWSSAWDDVVATLQADSGHEDLSVVFGERWEDTITSYLNGDMDMNEVFDKIDERDPSWSDAQDAWDSAWQSIME